jgi:uncharacterized membrane protein (Fun14 family)
MLIVVGFFTGMFFVGLQFLQKYGYVSTVNGISLEMTVPHRSNNEPLMLTQLIYMDYFIHLEFLGVEDFGC